MHLQTLISSIKKWKKYFEDFAKISLKKAKKFENKKPPKQEAKIEEPPKIKPLILTNFEAISHFGGCVNNFGGGNIIPLNTDIFLENSRQNFKSATKEKQLKLLFYYIAGNSKNGIYKKEDNRNIGEYFGVGKDLIQNRFNKLTEDGHMVKLQNKLYKISEDPYQKEEA